MPPDRSASASGERLIAVTELGEPGVALVETRYGDLAVGISGGRPFAVSNRCRHLRASLGEGSVLANGRLECPWHGARYDVRTGKMVRGPRGVFRPVSGVVKKTTGSVRLKTYDVEIRDGAIWLV